jgi:phosphoglycolate phosphatase-like HAD superfamily hydrolase
MEKIYQTILFDIDGTLIDSGGAGAASWRDAFSELYGIPADISEFTDTGMTDPEVGRMTFHAVLERDASKEEFSRLLERREFYLNDAVKNSEHYRILNGVEELLQKLISEGYLLGIITGNLEGAAHIKLHRANLNRFFAYGAYGSDSEDRGEITKIALQRASLVNGSPISQQACIVVGDTPHDAEGAHAAGLKCVGVASHKFTVEELQAGGADYVITDLTEALPLDRLL